MKNLIEGGKKLLKKTLRPVAALLAILLILFLNVGSFAINAYAWGSWDAPKWDAPKGEAPTWEAPEGQSPEWELSEWNAPEWNGPEWGAPDWRSPEWDSSGSGGDGSSVNDGTDIQIPGLPPKLPDGTVNPPYNDSYKHPLFEQLEKYRLPSSEHADPDPFFTFDEVTPYKGAKLAKDIAKETINFTDKILKNQNKDDYSPYKDFGNMHGKMLYAGAKTFTKGDPTLEAAAQAYDVVKGTKDLKGKYDTYRTFQDIKNLKNQGDILDAARKYDDLLSAGKTFTPANAIVSAITLPFSVKDTYDNMSKLNNASSPEEKTNTTWDLVGNAGEIITGTAAFVALIPGGQPIAAGMAVVGGILSLASLGHKLYRNREKIWTDIKKKGKAIADGAKKTWNKITSIFK